MQGERMIGNDNVNRKILGIVNVHRRIRSDSSMQGVGMLGNDNVHRKNARNPQYKVGKFSELSMQGEKC